ncbi:hypothetical protein IKI14_03120 [bacterium]|nr:hypothetical protein [bacterium]
MTIKETAYYFVTIAKNFAILKISFDQANGRKIAVVDDYIENELTKNLNEYVDDAMSVKILLKNLDISK